ncbi:MAG TPA: hypothetical protein VMU81_00505 [Acetobacteraceae bacterium]|nr:hypothetical protein [Acetobacteraceae bacterium]
MSDLNPLIRLTSDWLPQFDFALLSHGFLGHGRDYELVVQIYGRGTYRIILTHVVVASYETAVRPEVWVRSWEDVFLDYDRAVSLDGYIWGTNWSLAYPGLSFPEADPDVVKWSGLLGRQMHGAVLETDRLKLKFVFADVKAERLSDAANVIAKVTVPLPPGYYPGKV